MENGFSKAMAYRHACKIFDNSKKISDEDMNFILEMGRKSPSSFGVEPWKFLVITNQELKKRLKPICWNQAQIDSCSHLVVVLSNIDCAKIQSGEPRKRLQRRGLSDEDIDFYINLYSTHLSSTLSSDENIYHWTSKQTYLASANMMSGASYIGIDSCPIEGFEKEKVEELLELEPSKFQVSMLIAFGYRLNEQSKQFRKDKDEVIEFIK